MRTEGEEVRQYQGEHGSPAQSQLPPGCNCVSPIDLSLPYEKAARKTLDQPGDGFVEFAEVLLS